MLLSEEDILRLIKRGFSKKYFVKFDRKGYALLKNMAGYCVFYDQNQRRCSVYVDRPSGCRVYPVILDEEVGIILDDLCPNTGTISQAEKIVKGNRVAKLLDRIDIETAKRHIKRI
jgi:hypothetical protein